VAVIGADLRAWLRPGLAGTVATVDASGQPQLARVWSVRVEAGRDLIEIYVQRSSALAFAAGLASRGRAALNLIEVSSYRSRLFKGACEISPAAPDAAFLEENLTALNLAFSGVGMAAGSAQRMLSHSDAPHSMLALRLTVESVFDQSPKSGAGGPL
jgi:hypothetical protein